MAVLGEKVAGIRKAGRLAGRVFGKESLRIGGGGMGVIAAALTMEIDAQVAVAVCAAGNRTLIFCARTLTSWSPATLLVLTQFLLGPEALERGSGFHQGAVQAEVLPGKQFPGFGLLSHLQEEGLGHVARKEAFSVLREGGGVPDRFVQIEAHEPAKQQVILQVLAELALGRDGIEHLDEKGAQEILGRDGGTAALGVDLVKERRQSGKGLIGHLADGPQGVIFGDTVLQGTEEHKRRLACLFSPHPNPLHICPFAG